MSEVNLLTMSESLLNSIEAISLSLQDIVEEIRTLNTNLENIEYELEQKRVQGT